MSKIMEERMRMFEENRLGLDDTFVFGCKQCGNCCRERKSDILYTPHDVFRIAKHLGIRTGDVASKYGDSYVGPDSKLPLLAIKPKPHGRVCPYLNRKIGCTIHPVKPAACALFPLGRAVDYRTGELSYFLNSDVCGTRDQEHTVRDWIGAFHLEESEAFFREWAKFQQEFHTRFRKIEKTKRLKSREDELYFYFTGMLYVMYDLGKDFMPQFRDNVKTLDMYMQSLGI